LRRNIYYRKYQEHKSIQVINNKTKQVCTCNTRNRRPRKWSKHDRR